MQNELKKTAASILVRMIQSKRKIHNEEVLWLQRHISKIHEIVEHFDEIGTLEDLSCMN